MQIRRQIANLISNILNPFLMSLAVIILLSFKSTSSTSAALKWSLISVAASILPVFLVIVYLVRSEKLEGMSINVRRQRNKIYLLAVLCTVVGFIIILSAIIGSRVMYVLINTSYYTRAPLDMLKIWQGGLVFSGGVIGVVLTMFWYIQRHGLPLGKVADLWAPAIAIGQCLGRVGCFMAGCCYGKETDLGWGVTFTHPHSLSPLNTPLHPVQLYSSVSGLLTFLLVATLWVLNRVPSGFPVSLIAVLYGLFRFLDEWFRTQKKLLWRSLSPAQLVCIVVVLGGLLHLSVISASGLEPIWTFEYPPLAIRSLVDGLYRVRLIPSAAMGLLTALVFSYHRKEIGRWK